MFVRPIQLPDDLGLISDLIRGSFQYPENEGWSVQQDEQTELIEVTNNLRRYWPLMRVAQLAVPNLRDMIQGFIAEVDGKPAGMIMLQRRSGMATWIVATLGVLPTYRKRGLARRLMHEGLVLMQKREGALVWLDVIDGNFPAYRLYQDLGFEHFAGSVELVGSDLQRPTAPKLPAEYKLMPYDPFDWQTRFALEKGITPAPLQKYDPITEKRFQQPALMRLFLPFLLTMQGMQSRQMILTDGEGSPIGRIRYDLRKRPGGTHKVLVQLSNQHEALAPCLMATVVETLMEWDGDQVIKLDVAQWQPAVVAAAEAAGFKKRLEYHRMGRML